MLNLDEQRFLDIQAGAVGLAGALHAAVGDLLAAGAANLYFAGTGGAGILMLPAAGLLKHRSAFPVDTVMPAELALQPPAALGPRSIVVMPSLSGTTKESIEALACCQERGATVITLTGDPTAELAKRADLNFSVPAADDTSSESFYLQSLLIALSLLDARGETAEYAGLAAEIATLPSALLEVKRSFEDRAGGIAARLKDAPWHIVTGADSTWAEAFYYGMCILEEMQWIRTRPVHASDFFHGTLELVEAGVSVLALKGEDSGRALVERVEGFTQRYSDGLLVLDTRELAVPGISQRLRALISPVLLATVLERVSAHLEILTDHPLTTRRYYKRVQY